MSNTPSDDVVGEHTDELPVLVETTVLDDADIPRSSSADSSDLADTTENTANYPAFEPSDAAASAEIAELRHALEAREAQIATLESEVARFKQHNSTAATQIGAKDGEIAALKRIVDDLGTTLAEHKAAEQEARATLAERAMEHARLVAELAALQGALAAREADREKHAASHGPVDAPTDQSHRVAELERELAGRTSALRAAETLAAREVDRAKAARAALVDKALEVETLRRALAEGRAAEVSASRKGPPQYAATGATSDRRQSDPRLAELERGISDRDLALAAQDARIATLKEQLNALQTATHGEESPGAQSASPAVEPLWTPALACLTGDAPKHFILTKLATLIGRGAHCDVQILTHVVSREHARITLLPDGAVIEDLESTNGVLVNFQRVTRQPLRDGDLITLGETQFRFFEAMAH